MTKALIGYARCSTDKQDLAAQRAALIDLGVAPNRIYVDHGLTGTNRSRPGLDQALAAVRRGDTLVVSKLDRLALSASRLQEVSFEFAWQFEKPTGLHRAGICKGWVRPKLKTSWTLLLGKQPAADVMIIARLNPPARSVLDYFVFPAFSQLRGALHARKKDNDAFLDLYRFDDLQPFINSFRRYSLREAV